MPPKHEHSKTYSFYFENTPDHNHKPEQSTKGINAILILTQNYYQNASEISMNVQKDHLDLSRNN